MNIKSRIKELLQAGLALSDVVYSLIEDKCNPIDTARAFRELGYCSFFRRIIEDEGILELSPEPCYGEGGVGYKIPLLIQFPWPLEVEVL